MSSSLGNDEYIRILTNKKETIVYFLNKDYKGYSFKRDRENIFSEIKEIKHMFFLKKKSLLYRAEYFLNRREKEFILNFFESIDLKESIEFYIKSRYYDFLYITQEKESSKIDLNMINPDGGKKVRYIIPDNGKISKVEWTEEDKNKISFKIEENYDQREALKKILTKNERDFILESSDIKTKYDTFPYKLQERIPIKLFESIYREKQKNRFLPGYGRIKEIAKKVIF